MAPILAVSLCAQTGPVDNPGTVAPVGELFASDPSGVAIAQPAGSGMNVLPGAELSAGVAAATLKLARGGQVRICPRSSLNINRGGQGLMLGLGSGSIEIDYRLTQSATDVLVTPDFNIRLVGPAAYHFAVGVNEKGDTCFRGLRGNASGVVFSELLGEDSYGVMADEGALFAGGKLATKAALTSECGCPAPPPAMRAGAAEPGNTATPTPPPLVPTADVTAPLPPARPGEAHVEVEAPFVFSARDAAKPNTAAKLNVSLLPNVFFVQEEDEPAVLVEKPAEVSVKSDPEPVPKIGANEKGKDEATKEKKGFLARIKGFFGAMFHR